METFPDYRSSFMYAWFIFTLLVVSSAGYDEVAQLWICPKAPSTCLSRSSASKMAEECLADGDCQVGAQCCYRGCVRICQFPNPCEKVICNDGYLCQSQEKPCETPPCQHEATCLPAAQVRCIAPVCNTHECKPGWERTNDTNGCPTCVCVKKPECGPNCLMLCAFGFEEGPNGCPLCACKPEPQNPCSNMSCEQNKECRFVQVVCKRPPCIPVAMCVPITHVQYDNVCSLTDSTTVGLPVLDINAASELDCYLQDCPEHTVCTNMGREIKRCCWQATQEQVLSPPKVGKCPLVANFSRPTQKCQVDGTCPGEQKCCYRQTNNGSTRSYGFCTNPTHKIIKLV